jgi:hypothetical protein
MMKNGRRQKVLGQRPPYGPEEVALLHAERLAVLLGLATTDAERRTIEAELVGWEERPNVSALVERLERRVVDPDDRWILERVRGFRILLPSAPPEPAPDPVLEQLILDRVAKKVQAQTIADSRLDALVAVHLELRKAKTPEDVEKLLAKERAAADERTDAVTALEKEISRLADLLQQRARRHRAFMLTGHTS